jgi:UDP-sugar pyrophosphorylase
MLQQLGARVDGPQAVEFNGLKGLELWPRVTWSPIFACCWDDLRQRVQGSGVHIGADSALVVQAPGARIQSLDLKRGALVVRGSGAPGEEVVVEGVTVDNAGWAWAALSSDEGAAEEEYIRGFRVVRHEQREL